MTRPVVTQSPDDVLKPCPFCGGTATVQTVLRALVRCADCGAEGHSVSMIEPGVAVASERAVAAWNHRPVQSPDEGDEYDDDRDALVCPRCQGDGTVDCHCGGDLCVCLNYGERDCPTCHGEGEVSEERHARYLENQREAHAAMLRVWEQSK